MENRIQPGGALAGIIVQLSVRLAVSATSSVNQVHGLTIYTIQTILETNRT